MEVRSQGFGTKAQNPKEVSIILVYWQSGKGHRQTKYEVPTSLTKKGNCLSHLMKHIRSLKTASDANLAEGDYILKVKGEQPDNPATKRNDIVLGSYRLPLDMKIEDALKGPIETPDVITLMVITPDKYFGGGHNENAIYQVNFLGNFIDEKGKAKLPINLHSICPINGGRLGRAKAGPGGYDNFDPNYKLNRKLVAINCKFGIILVNLESALRVLRPPVGHQLNKEYNYQLKLRVDGKDIDYTFPNKEIVAYKLEEFHQHVSNDPYINDFCIITPADLSKGRLFFF